MSSLLLATVLLSLAVTCFSQLEVGFYRGRCGINNMEAIIRDVVAYRFRRDPTIVAALLRLQFHDCFVRGCDASLLLDGKNTEKTAFPNLSVRGFDLIDDAKAAVESACPGLVSCADIIAIATRDAVAMAGGGRFEVQTGRRDNTVSLASDVNLPPPFVSVADSIAVFRGKGLDVNDMVVLLGGHTVGATHCSLFADRIYNFSGTGRPDPTMDPRFGAGLRAWCSRNGRLDDKPVNLDENLLSSYFLDNSFYKQILMGRGILGIDQAIALDPATRNIVTSLAYGFDFPTQFGNAMVKLGAIQVLTGTDGEIRKSCRAINTN